MILVLSASDDATANYLCRSMEAIHEKYFRIDTDLLSELKLEIGVSAIASRGDVRMHADEVSSVWFRRPEIIAADGQETYESQCFASEWRACLNGYLSFIPAALWVNHPKNNAVASYKIEQLRRSERFGLIPPEWILTQSPDAAFSFYRLHDEKVVVKPVGGGYFSNREETSIGLIYTNPMDRGARISDFASVSSCPTLLQRAIYPKTDVRVLICDDSIVATAIESNEFDVRRNNMNGVRYRTIAVPTQITIGIKAFVRSYDLRFSALDFAICEDGSWYFLENNPNGQWAWIEIHGGPKFSPYLLDSLRGNNDRRSRQ